MLWEPMRLLTCENSPCVTLRMRAVLPTLASPTTTTVTSASLAILEDIAEETDQRFPRERNSRKMYKWDAAVSCLPLDSQTVTPPRDHAGKMAIRGNVPSGGLTDAAPERKKVPNPAGVLLLLFQDSLSKLTRTTSVRRCGSRECLPMGEKR